MWSWQLNRLKKRLVRSKNFARQQIEANATYRQGQKTSAYVFTNMGHWQYIVELFVASCVLALVLVVAKSQSLQSIWSFNVLQYIIYINWVVIAFAVIVNYFQAFFNRISQIKGLMISFLLLQLIVIVTTFSLNVVEATFCCHTFNLSNYTAARLFDGLTLHLTYGILLGAFCLRYLYIRDQWQRQQNSELESRIQAMQARIQPHFLFNSLNSVVSLITIDPEKAEDALINLSQLFRVSFQQLRLVTLAEEIRICKQYIAIEKIRLADRLNVTWRLPNPKYLDAIQIPLLSLQPLLENSIFHGVERISGLCEVSILVEILDTRVNIVITNPYQEDMGSVRQGHGIALENIKQRLKAYYGRHASLQSSASDHVFTTVLSYKYLKHKAKE
ncbi:sensor histidine kinase [Acinetobacter sp. HY1485]|uniref:sensor histidine kinase n=1 Tax=Acinetobacter sp. HY1485 TaxID=2970918 RepID=UPI0022B99FC4|nr:histidine kinase [Acinetobacter sp. HY1485]